MTDLSFVISFTSFKAYYIHLGPAAVEKASRVYSYILAVYHVVTVPEITYLFT